jgi:ABC-type transport system substrate-binding protein
MTKILILLISLSLTSCFQKTKTDIDNNTLYHPLSGEVSTLDPANSYDVISAAVVYQSLEPLYQYHYLKRPYTLEPLLAKEMPKVEQNGLRYIIPLKKNIQYHDDPAFNGKPRFVKAQDFITQIKRLAFIPNASNGWWLFDGKIKGINEFRDKVGMDLNKLYTTPIEGVKALDDHTLQIDLSEPYPQMTVALAMSFTAPVPEEVVRKYENKLSDKMIGTGPFMLEKWNRLSGITLVKNPNYHESLYPTQGDRLAHSRGMLQDAGKKLPFLDKIEFKIMKESQTRWLNFLSKKVHILKNIPKDNYQNAVTPQGSLSKDLRERGIQLQAFPTLTYWWLSFNMKDSIFSKNKNLRLAVAHAFDFDRHIELFTNKIGQKANSIYPPGVPGYYPNANLPYKYDLKKAKEYLKAAGYPNGKGLPEISFDVRGTSAQNRQLGEFLKSQMEKVGIPIKVTTNTFPDFLEKAKKGELEFWQDGWTLDYPDAQNVLQLLLRKNFVPGPNVTYYHNPKFEKLFDELKFLPEGKRKWDLMKEMEDVVNNDLPWVMQYYARNYVLFHGNLKNFRHSDLIYNNMKYLKLEKR